ncbi:putative riboflavin kinase [Condylostylus longicornis]|uniref:putative riboflavin kinase n=1 Tax=Condylostylus longicornis TaxID=2530218 RepID=UPI00244DF5C4|nr:putative riboflavin kinase [Condylostylus longicornis]
MTKGIFPYFAAGEIVKGFGRGSKDLGIPTANFPLNVVQNLPPNIETGIYYGFANVDNGPVHEMVMSIGWNPFFHNKEKSMETHILHDYNQDLYGCILKVCILGYIRPEKNFDSLDLLINAIKDDIQQAKKLCNLPSNKGYITSNFFKKGNSSDGGNSVI